MAQAPQKMAKPFKSPAAPKRSPAKGFAQMQKMMGRGTGTPRKFATPKLK